MALAYCAYFLLFYSPNLIEVELSDIPLLSGTSKLYQVSQLEG